MNKKIYLKNKIPVLVVNLLSMTGLSVFLFLNGNYPDTILFILLVWALILTSGLAIAYWHRKKQLDYWLSMAEYLEKRYLISEVMEKPERADDKWVRFILNQLIVNAVKYRSDHPVITFCIAQKDGSIILSIQDNGIGIGESDLPRIFEKGFTGKNGRSRIQSKRHNHSSYFSDS